MKNKNNATASRVAKQVLAVLLAASSMLTANATANVLPSVSLTSPAPNGNYVGPASIPLVATAADSDGTVAKVAFYRDAVLVGSVTAAPYALNWTNAPAGTYSVTARATDNAGGVTTSAPVQVVVKTNIPPTVALTKPNANASYASPGTVSLSVNAADSDGTIAKVSYFQGETIVRTATTAPFDSVWTNVPVGDYSISAKAYDDKGGITTTAAVPISVKANMPPSVTLTGSGQDVVSPGAIALSAIAADSDGTITRVAFYDGTVLKGTVFSAPYTLQMTNIQTGSHSITARATDDKGIVTTSAPVVIDVKANAVPTTKITSFVSPTTFNVPGSMTLTATAADSDGTVTKVVFFYGTTEIGTVTAAPYTVTWTNPPPGSYNLTSKAYDNKGITGASPSMTVHVKAPPVPVVSIVTPAHNTRFIAPSSFPVTATATVTGDTISKVEFISAGSLIGTATSAPYTIIMNNVPVGTYNVTAKAFGKLGGTATSSVVDLVVANNVAPAISLTATQTRTTAPTDVTLTANASDADGVLKRVEFFNGQNLLATVTASPYTYTWTGVDTGSYAITARATDNLEAATTTPVSTITVGSPAPVGNAEVFYIYTDQINTAREITNAAGTKVWVADPDPFAANLPNENPTGAGQFTFNQRFPGQYFDRESGLHYNYYRDYDPQTGRYIQSDPIGLEGGINTYGYVGGNPISRIDPLGLSFDAGFAAGFSAPADSSEADSCGPNDKKCVPPKGLRGWARALWLTFCLVEGKRPPEAPKGPPKPTPAQPGPPPPKKPPIPPLKPKE